MKQTNKQKTQLETEFSHIKERLRATEAQLEEERRSLASLRRKVVDCYYYYYYYYYLLKA